MAKLQVADLMRDLRRHAVHSRHRTAFLERARLRAAFAGEQGLSLVGVGSSCGKPAFALRYLLVWTERNTRALEGLAARYFCSVDYGNAAHLKQHHDGQELAAIQDFSPSGIVYLRAEYAYADELLRDLITTLSPHAARNGHEGTIP